MADTLKLSQIQRDGSCQSRASWIAQVAQDYCDAMLQGVEFPPVVVFFDGKTYWLADGHYRCAARELYAAAKGWQDCSIEAKVRNGDQRAAMLYAVGCNDAHGVRRTNADKRHAVKMLLADPEWAEAATHWIAEKCSVSDSLVEDVRSTSGTGSCQRKGKDGKVRKPPKPRQPKAERAAGDDSEAIKAEKQAAKRVGKEVFDWRAYNAAIKTILQQIDGLAKHLGMVDDAGAIKGDRGYLALDRKLKDLNQETKAWFKKHTKLESPE